MIYMFSSVTMSSTRLAFLGLQLRNEVYEWSIRTMQGILLVKGYGFMLIHMKTSLAFIIQISELLITYKKEWGELKHFFIEFGKKMI